MDFHLYSSVGRDQCDWLVSPASRKTCVGKSRQFGNFEVLGADGSLAGMIAGWSDLDIHELWKALHEPGLEHAKSLLACAEGTFAGVFNVKNNIYITTDVSGSIPVYFGFDEVSSPDFS